MKKEPFRPGITGLESGTKESERPQRTCPFSGKVLPTWEMGKMIRLSSAIDAVNGDASVFVTARIPIKIPNIRQFQNTSNES
jgi:hypothetical protein